MAYTKVTNFAVKDGLPSGNPSKIVKGTEIDVEFNAIQAESVSVTAALAGKQPLDTSLTSLAALATAADKLAYTTAADTWAETSLTSAARTVLDDITVVDMRTTLGAAASGANTDISSLASPALGAATATTQTAGDNTTKVATTAFVTTATTAAVTDKIQSVTATQGFGAVTFTLNPTTLDFRSITLTTGVPVTRTVASPITLVLPSGGTLGAVTTVSARLILVAIDNAGTPELAVVNIAGGNDLSETGVINTTAISASSTANNVFYSTTGRTGVAYRVVGAVDAVNTTGAWGNPTLVQGFGGQALAAMSSLGYGQTYQNVGGSRALSTTYYNTTGKPFDVIAFITNATQSTITVTVGGVSFSGGRIEAGSAGIAKFTVPPGMSYLVANTSGSISSWYELR